MSGKGGVYTALIGPIASLEEVHMIFEVSASIAVSGVRDGNRREQAIGPENGTLVTRLFETLWTDGIPRTYLIPVQS